MFSQYLLGCIIKPQQCQFLFLARKAELDISNPFSSFDLTCEEIKSQSDWHAQ